jgi:type VI secretion system secreted protein VgrG
MEKPDGVIGPNGPTILALTGGGNVHLKPDKDEHKIPKHVNDFITMALPHAKKVKAAWGVPIGGLIAQSALETGWGRHVKDNAYFGIKGKSEKGASTSFTTREVIDGKSVTIVDTFRAYKDFEEAADDYGRFLNTNDRYKEALKYPDDPINFVKEIAKAGYATDPNYAKSLVSIIKSYGLAQYDKP